MNTTRRVNLFILMPFLLLMPLILPGCAQRVLSVLTSSPPVYYQLEYASEPLTCPSPFENGLRIWPFAGSAPYDRRDMVVLTASHEVQLSRQNQWVANPGEMITDRLLQDFNKSSLFSKVVTANDPFAAPLELSGQIYKFAWQQENSTAYGILDVEVSLWEEKVKRRVLFRKNYRLQSKPFSENDPGRFAEVMSDLMRQFSNQLSRDLCAMGKGSLSPGAE